MDSRKRQRARALDTLPTRAPRHCPATSFPRQILIRLRQAVDHPYLVIYSATKREGMTPAIAPALGNPPPGTNASSAETPSANGDARGGERAARDGGSRGTLSGVHDPGDTSSGSEDELPKARDLAGVGTAAGAGGNSDDEEDGDELCAICSEPPERPVASDCGHSFCWTW